MVLIAFSCQKEDVNTVDQEATLADVTLDHQQQREEDFVKNFVGVFGKYSKQEELLNEIGNATDPILLGHILDTMTGEAEKSGEMDELKLFDQEVTKNSDGLQVTDVLFDMGTSEKVDVEEMLFAFLPVEEEAPYFVYNIKGERLGLQETKPSKSILYFDRYGWHSFLSEMDLGNQKLVEEGLLDKNVYLNLKHMQNGTENQMTLDQESARPANRRWLSVGKVKAKDLKAGNRRAEVYTIIAGFDLNRQPQVFQVPLTYVKTENIFNFPVGKRQRNEGIFLANWDTFAKIDGVQQLSITFMERNRNPGFFRTFLNFLGKGLAFVVQIFKGSSTLTTANKLVAEINKVVPNSRKDDVLDIINIGPNQGKPKTKGKPFPRRATKEGVMKNMTVSFINRRN